MEHGIVFEDFRRMALALPGVEEGSSYGTPGFRVKGKFLARLREPDVLVLKPIDDLEKEFLMATQPETFFITDHYHGYPAVLIRLSVVDRDQMQDLLLRAWQALAPRKLIAAYEAAVVASSGSGDLR